MFFLTVGYERDKSNRVCFAIQKLTSIFCKNLKDKKTRNKKK